MHKSGAHWQNTANRKRFYEVFARKHGFDPLVLGNWNTVSRNLMRSVEVCTTLWPKQTKQSK
jgi:hypothetical protein